MTHSLWFGCNQPSPMHTWVCASGWGSIFRRRVAARASLRKSLPTWQTYLSGVELGKRNPSIVVLDRIAIALGLDIADLTKK
jgi:transcriptional regulator with XRE-family HTH domain